MRWTKLDGSFAAFVIRQYSRCDTILDSAGAGEMALGTFRSVSSEPKHDASVAIDDGK